MTNKEAIERIERHTYELAKHVSSLAEIKQSMDFIIEDQKWDGMFLCEFSEALAKLADVVSAAVVYSLEEKYRENDINEMQATLNALRDEPAEN